MVGDSDAPQPVQAAGFQSRKSDALQTLTIGEASSVGYDGNGSAPQGGRGPDSAPIEFALQRTAASNALRTSIRFPFRDVSELKAGRQAETPSVVQRVGDGPEARIHEHIIRRGELRRVEEVDGFAPDG